MTGLDCQLLLQLPAGSHDVCMQMPLLGALGLACHYLALGLPLCGMQLGDTPMGCQTLPETQPGSALLFKQ